MVTKFKRPGSSHALVFFGIDRGSLALHNSTMIEKIKQIQGLEILFLRKMRLPGCFVKNILTVFQMRSVE